MIGWQGRCALEHFGQRVGAFQGRDDAFKAAAFVEGIQGFGVGHRGVFDATDVMQPGVLRADAGVVQAGDLVARQRDDLVRGQAVGDIRRRAAGAWPGGSA